MTAHPDFVAARMTAYVLHAQNRPGKNLALSRWTVNLHSRVGVTLDLYSHVRPGMQEDAASRVDEVLQLAIERRKSKDVR